MPLLNVSDPAPAISLPNQDGVPTTLEQYRGQHVILWWYPKADTLGRIKQTDAERIKFVCLLAAPEGIEAFANAHPDVPIYTAAIDRQLNDHGYILPGLGDAGDRMYGTK